MIEGMRNNWKHALRGLRRNPGFAITACLSLALGIGVNTAIFSFVNTVFLRPPDVRDPGGLVRVHPYFIKQNSASLFSYPNYIEVARRSQTTEGMLAYRIVTVNVGAANSTERAWGLLVSANYFDLLGVSAAQGRTFLAEEGRTEMTHPVVVVSHSYWQRRLRGQPDIAGKTITINTRPFTVAGVAPKDFHGTDPLYLADLWFPLQMQPAVEVGGSWLASRGAGMLSVVARLKPGVTPAQAGAEMRSIAAALAQQYPDTNANETIKVVAGLGTIAPQITDGLLFFSTFLMAVVGLVMLLACANLANLLLARAAGRMREIAVRLSIGATRSQLIQQLLAEALAVSLLGGISGVLLGQWLLSLLGAIRLPMPVPVQLNYPLDWRVVLFALALSAGTGIAFGLLPALRASNPDLVPSLKEGASGGYRRSYLRDGLVVAQVALSFILVTAAGLFLRSLILTQAIDPGFETRRLLLATIEVANAGYDAPRGQAFYSQFLDKLRATPGVSAASLTHDLPFALNRQSTTIALPGEDRRTWRERPYAGYSTIATDYFKAMGNPLVAGRDFAATDTPEKPRVAIVNEAMVRQLWPGERDVLGKRLSLRGPDGPFLEVVGVARDSRNLSPQQPARPMVFIALSQSFDSFLTAVIRTEGDPAALGQTVRSILHSLDPNLPLMTVQTMPEYLSFSLLPARIAAAVLGFFGLMALVIASSGIYGVMAYMVSRRTREIGIRMALGATAGDTIGRIVGQGLRVAGVGLILGIGGALALGQVTASLLFGISATDPLVFVSGAMILSSVAFLACFFPARKAMRVDPLIALRYD